MGVLEPLMSVLYVLRSSATYMSMYVAMYVAMYVPTQQPTLQPVHQLSYEVV